MRTPEPIAALRAAATPEVWAGFARAQMELEQAPVNELERGYREWRKSLAGRYLYPMFRKFALSRAEMGERFGVKALAERVRWEVSLAERPYRDYKVNNSHVAYIARDLAREYPELADLIEFRRVKEDLA